MYVKSIYFRDPDGPILEIATCGTGWTVDEPAENLGARVVTPLFETTAVGRDEIAARLTPLRVQDGEPPRHQGHKDRVRWRGPASSSVGPNSSVRTV